MQHDVVLKLLAPSPTTHQRGNRGSDSALRRTRMDGVIISALHSESEENRRRTIGVGRFFRLSRIEWYPIVINERTNERDVDEWLAG